MKLILTILFFAFYFQVKSQPLFSEKGHPEHFIAGTVVSGLTSYYVYKKTNSKLKSRIIGAASAALLGYLKEVVDPKWFNGVRSGDDFKYSAFGAILGASVVIPLKSKNTANIIKMF